jgi:hypothetical protein
MQKDADEIFPAATLVPHHTVNVAVRRFAEAIYCLVILLSQIMIQARRDDFFEEVLIAHCIAYRT